MKFQRLGTLAMGAALAAFATLPVAAAEQTLTGRISDSMCGASHKAAMEHGGKKMTDAECVKACVKGGGQYVLVREGKAIPIANQDFAGLEQHAGQDVRVTGDMNGDKLTISKIEPAAHHGKKAGAKNPA